MTPPYRDFCQWSPCKDVGSVWAHNLILQKKLEVYLGIYTKPHDNKMLVTHDNLTQRGGESTQARQNMLMGQTGPQAVSGSHLEGSPGLSGRLVWTQASQLRGGLGGAGEGSAGSDV